MRERQVDVAADVGLIALEPACPVRFVGRRRRGRDSWCRCSRRPAAVRSSASASSARWRWRAAARPNTSPCRIPATPSDPDRSCPARCPTRTCSRSSAGPRAVRREPKKKRRFLTIGPPNEPPNSLWLLVCLVVLEVADRRQVVGIEHESLDRSRAERAADVVVVAFAGEQVAARLRHRADHAAEAPPYSASIPPVFTWTSCRYSNTVFCRELP